METKNEKFQRLAEKRVNETIKKIELIGNLSNKRNYQYTEDDINKVLKALKNALKDLEQKFKTTKPTKFKF